MNEYYIFLMSLVAGGIGYLFVTFHMRPSLRYIDLKHQICSDLIFYANAIDDTGMNDDVKEKVLKRIEANRRHSSELTACYIDLPFWHKCYIKCRKHCPEKASKNLMGLSNTREDMAAAGRIDIIKSCLGIKTDVV